MSTSTGIYEVIETYELEIIGPPETARAVRDGAMYLDSSLLRETEERMSNELPEGYYVKFRETVQR